MRGAVLAEATCSDRACSVECVTAETHARALRLFGDRDLVDLIGVMAQHADDAALLTAFEQQLPAGQMWMLVP